MAGRSRFVPTGPFVLTAAFAGAVLAVAYCGFILQAMVHQVVPALAPPALATASLLYLGTFARWPPELGAGTRSLAATALGTAVAAPIFAALAHYAMALPLVSLHDRRDGDAIRAMQVFAGVLFASVLLVGLTARWMRDQPPRRVAPLDWLLALAAPAALVATVALVAASFASPRPAPDDYVRSLPMLGATPASASAFPERTDLGVLAIWRRCPWTLGCDVWVTAGGADPPDPRANPADFSVKNPVVVARRDAARDLWIVGTDGPPGVIGDDAQPAAAYRAGDLKRVEVRPRTLAGGLSPPRGWIVAAAIGAVIAGRRYARRRAAKRDLAEILAAARGWMDEDGWITLARGGALLRAPAGTKVAPGRVLVVGGAKAGAGAYRAEAAGVADRVLGGTRWQLAREARQALVAIDARTLAAVAVTAAPLAMAWVEGLQ